jgi:hypothetical protein
MLALRHCAATVREDEDGTAGCRGAPLAGEVGDDGWWCCWPWPWELVRWSRHLNDPAWVGGAQTHLGAAPWWPAPDGADADPGQPLRVVFGDAAAPVGVVLLLWWPWPWNLPSSPVVST